MNPKDFLYSRFPEELFAAENSNEYLRRVAQGASIASSKNVIITGLCRNIMPVLKYTVARLRKTGELFNDYRVLIYENDSNDGTSQALKKYFQNDNKTTLAQETTGVPMFGKTRELDRPRYLAGLRNISFEGVRLLNKFFPTDYIIVVDLDLEGGWSYDGICHSFSYDNWSAMTANGLEYVDATYVGTDGTTFSEYKPLFYDTWAWRDIDTKMTEVPDSAEVNELRFNRGDEIVEVNSNFNGLGIYEYEEAIDCKFDAIPTDSGDVVNEWAYFHNEMKKRGSRIFMNPSMIALYTPTIYSGKY
tara:strand:- start:314 stop:1222 length:909 start_codon:yes stop_codon:yes gene_type:complete